MRKKIALFLYKAFAKKLPLSKMQICKKIRYILVKNIVKSCGIRVNVDRGATFSPNIEIGDFSGIGENSRIEECVKIGKNVMMGPECYIYTRNHKFDRTDIPMIQQGFSETKEVIIEDDVWIGSRVTILPGVTIGKGTVIGAGSIVTKSIPEFSVACGNPAKVKRIRK